MKKFVLTSLLVCATAQPALAVIPKSGVIEFEIMRNGSSLGHHSVVFKKEGAETQVDIDIDMQLKIGPLPLFSYEHQNTEIWRGNQIESVRSRTVDDGRTYQVEAAWGKDLQVTANGETYEMPAKGVFSTSYWNPMTVKSPQLLNTQKGQIEDVTVTYLGQAPFQTAVETLTADHYRVEASLTLDVWYDSKTKQWVGLKFNVRGSEIEYKRLNSVNDAGNDAGQRQTNAQTY